MLFEHLVPALRVSCGSQHGCLETGCLLQVIKTPEIVQLLFTDSTCHQLCDTIA